MTARLIIHKKTRTVTADILRHDQYFKAGIGTALHDIGNSVAKENIRLIKSGPKTGRKHPGLPNRSSAPHQAPADQSGKLAASTGYKARGFTQLEVGETADYADFLESGTRNTKPRPSLLKAVNNEARNTVNTLLQHVENRIK